ncbi:MAG: hypothetical protein QF907_05190 [Nitrospinota bacterium]|nr:hypothetical protein [Nitrospinota bacterium]MDP7579848.1 hypothetical protein [Nitrospinota bacterium]HJN01827.1 hypothetical protein [Nitrospinota bacterium]
MNILKSAGIAAAVMTLGLLLSGALPAQAAQNESKSDAPAFVLSKAELEALAAAPKIKELGKLSEDQIFELMDLMDEAAENELLTPAALEINEAILNEELILRNKTEN